MNARIIRTAAALTAALALGIGSAAWTAAASAAAAPAAAAPHCSYGSLAVWVNASSADGAAGTIYYDLEVTNISRHACSLRGYPGVSATTSSGRQIGAAASRLGTAPAKTVTIAPGGTAHSVFGYVDGAVANCHPVKTASYLKVYPPDDTGARYAFFSEPVCAGKTIDLVIERVAAGI